MAKFWHAQPGNMPLLVLSMFALAAAMLAGHVLADHWSAEHEGMNWYFVASKIRLAADTESCGKASFSMLSKRA